MCSQTELPDDINFDLIDSGLYLGNLTTALDIPTLKKLNISHILTVASEPLPDTVKDDMPGIKVCFIKVDDMPSSNLLSYFDESCHFIDNALASGGNVLVHCYFGVSRSATLVAAHLMKKHGLNSLQALDRLRARRRYVGPNEGFLQQLALYGALGYTLDGSNRRSALYRLHSLRGLVAVIRTEPYRLKELFSSFVSQLQQDPPVNASPGLMCRSCSIVLCSKNSVLEHTASDATLSCHTEVLSRLTPAPSQCQTVNLSDAEDTDPVCRFGVYILPQPWMQGKTCSVTATMAGPVFCFKCRAKLGSYHWLRGVQCRCYTQSSSKPSSAPASHLDHAAIILLDTNSVNRST